MLLYDNPLSGNCYKVRLLLAQLGMRYERRELSVADRSNRSRVLGGLNPALRVPTLVLDDGRPLGESNAILWYLGQGTRYLPDDRYQRAQMLQWQFFEQYDHEPNVAVARFWLQHRAADLDPQALAAKQTAGYRALDAMERHLNDRRFLVGERYTLADISLYAYTHVAEEGGFELSRYPAIRAWLARVAAEPGHVAIDA
ncbi:MAG TPA: glutathione S-transferase family protein [Candidatus Polarisedimenticolaceae bacterium]|nr:glutathione S-transferase family protein [Candidatus Polarisedimenticolaceae bacterium]